MTNIITLKNISFAHGYLSLFEGISLGIQAHCRMALVGANGSGKSTLLRLIAGHLQPSKGEIVLKRNLRVAYVEQFLPDALATVTVFDYIASQIQMYCDEATDGYLVQIALDELQIPQLIWRKSLGSLSGGELNWSLFAAAKASQPELILFDEPTNHMDILAISRFERFLQELDCAYIIVSHDRRMLDNCSNKTLVLHNGKLLVYGMRFNDARKQMQADHEAALATREDQEKEIQRLSESARQLRTWARNFSNEKFAKRAANIDRRIDRLNELKVSIEENKKRRIALGSGELAAKTALLIENLSIFTPDGRHLFGINTARILAGEKIFVVGANGTGKTTFLKRLVYEFAISKTASHKNSVCYNPQVTIGYYDQQLGNFDFDKSVFNNLHEWLPNETKSKLCKELINAGFAYNDHSKKVALLSGGEKARLKLLGLKLLNPNFFILDEPTNHIDVEGCEQLEQVLISSTATCIIVSHDREFLNHIAERVFLIRDGILNEVNSFSEVEEYLRNHETMGNEESQIIQSKSPETIDDIMSMIESKEKLLRREESPDKFNNNSRRFRELKIEIARLYQMLQEKI